MQFSSRQELYFRRQPKFITTGFHARSLDSITQNVFMMFSFMSRTREWFRIYSVATWLLFRTRQFSTYFRCITSLILALAICHEIRCTKWAPHFCLRVIIHGVTVGNIGVPKKCTAVTEYEILHSLFLIAEESSQAFVLLGPKSWRRIKIWLHFYLIRRQEYWRKHQPKISQRKPFVRYSCSTVLEQTRLEAYWLYLLENKSKISVSLYLLTVY